MSSIQTVLFCSLSILFKITFCLNKSSFDTTKSVHDAHLVGLFVSSSELPIFLEIMKPTLEISVEAANKKFPQLNITLSIESASSTCKSNRAGAIAAEKYYQGHVSAFIGPACSLALDSVARMASFWNVPILTAGGIDSKFSNKDLYRTLSRLSFSLGKFEN